MNVHEPGRLSSWPDFVDNFFMPIALLTDFGTRDYFVAAMKGVILSINSEAVIVDITHDVRPQDVREAAFTLRACYRDFPPGTIFVAVVDPGVGSARRAIVAEAGGYYFLAPDNGLLSCVTSDATVRVFEITNREFLSKTVSTTFHGRDIFAPAAAHLSRGASPAEFGPETTDYVCVFERKPAVSDRGIEGEVIHIDRFGNVITNLTPDDLPAGFILNINGRTIDAHREFYLEAEEGEIFSIWGSAGYLEISVRNSSAKDVLGAQTGQRVSVKGQ